MQCCIVTSPGFLLRIEGVVGWHGGQRWLNSSVPLVFFFLGFFSLLRWVTGHTVHSDVQVCRSVSRPVITLRVICYRAGHGPSLWCKRTCAVLYTYFKHTEQVFHSVLLSLSADLFSHLFCVPAFIHLLMFFSLFFPYSKVWWGSSLFAASHSLHQLICFFHWICTWVRQAQQERRYDHRCTDTENPAVVHAFTYSINECCTQGTRKWCTHAYKHVCILFLIVRHSCCLLLFSLYLSPFFYFPFWISFFSSSFSPPFLASLGSSHYLSDSDGSSFPHQSTAETDRARQLRPSMFIQLIIHTFPSNIVTRQLRKQS